jgi:hypothetical protein
MGRLEGKTSRRQNSRVNLESVATIIQAAKQPGGSNAFDRMPRSWGQCGSAARYQEAYDFLHAFQSLIVAANMSLTAVRSHLPERLFRSAAIRAAALAVPRWTFAASQAMA